MENRQCARIKSSSSRLPETFGGGDGPSPGSSLELGKYPRPNDDQPRLAKPNWTDVAAYPTLFITTTAHTTLTVPSFPLVCSNSRMKPTVGFHFSSSSLSKAVDVRALIA